VEADASKFDRAKLEAIAGQATVSIGLALRSKKDKKQG